MLKSMNPVASVGRVIPAMEYPVRPSRAVTGSTNQQPPKSATNPQNSTNQQPPSQPTSQQTQPQQGLGLIPTTFAALSNQTTANQTTTPVQINALGLTNASFPQSLNVLSGAQLFTTPSNSQQMPLSTKNLFPPVSPKAQTTISTPSIPFTLPAGVGNRTAACAEFKKLYPDIL